jgi:hypothetical protein
MLSMEIEAIREKLILSVEPADSYKIILIGSYAEEDPNEKSSRERLFQNSSFVGCRTKPGRRLGKTNRLLQRVLDIRAILDNGRISKICEERLNKKGYIRSFGREINCKMAIDILVYSKKEFSLIKKGCSKTSVFGETGFARPATYKNGKSRLENNRFWNRLKKDGNYFINDAEKFGKVIYKKRNGF